MINNGDYKKLLETIINLVKPTNASKKKRADVFTPLTLVEEMLDKLPNEVWKRPYFKWLDPANGIGNFPICVFIRLMESLSTYQDMYIDLRDEEVRRKWIVQEMLYVSELDI